MSIGYCPGQFKTKTKIGCVMYLEKYRQTFVVRVSQEKYQIWIEFQLKLILQKYNKNDVRSMQRNNEKKNIEKSPTRSLFDYNQK